MMHSRLTRLIVRAAVASAACGGLIVAAAQTAHAGLTAANHCEPVVVDG